MLSITSLATSVTGEACRAICRLTHVQIGQFLDTSCIGVPRQRIRIKEQKNKICRKSKLKPKHIPVMTQVNSKNERGMR